MTPLVPQLHDSPLYAQVIERPVSWHTRTGDIGGPLKNHKALVRVDAKKQPQPVAVVKHTYKLVQTVDLLIAVEKAMLKVEPALNADNVCIKDTIAEWGKHCIRDYTFRSITADIGAKSDVALRIIVSNSYGGKSIRVLGGAIEYYCSNGLIVGDYDTVYHRHTNGLKLESIEDNIRNCIMAFRGNVRKWKTWTGIKVQHEQAMSLFRAIAKSPRMFDQLAERYVDECSDRGDNLWSVVSTLTHYSTHQTVKASKNDTEAVTRMGRELDVRDWMNTDAFKQLATT